MQRFKVHSHSQAVSPTHRSLQPVASSTIQPNIGLEPSNLPLVEQSNISLVNLPFSINCHKFVSAIDIFCMFHKNKKNVNNINCHYNPYVGSEYLETHKEEIKSQFVLSTEEEAERDSRNEPMCVVDHLR